MISELGFRSTSPARGSAFTSKYNVCNLVYFERFDSIVEAFAREKQLKAGTRSKKIELVEKANPTWKEVKWF